MGIPGQGSVRQLFSEQGFYPPLFKWIGWLVGWFGLRLLKRYLTDGDKVDLWDRTHNAFHLWVARELKNVKVREKEGSSIAALNVQR